MQIILESKERLGEACALRDGVHSVQCCSKLAAFSNGEWHGVTRDHDTLYTQLQWPQINC